MKLSELILTGCEKAPAGRYSLRALTTNPTGYRTCALGALVDGAGRISELYEEMRKIQQAIHAQIEADKKDNKKTMLMNRTSIYEVIMRMFPDLKKTSPVRDLIIWEIVYRNDILQESRETIAAWLASIGL